MKLITKIKKAKSPQKKQDLWLDADMSQEEAKALVKDMVLTCKGCYHLYNREYGENIVDKVFEIYGWMPSMFIDEALIMGLTITHPRKVHASFTHNLDIIEIK